MQTIELPSLSDQVRNLPAAGAGRERELQRLVDLHALAEAIGALRASAAPGRAGARVLVAADAVLGGDADARDQLRDAVSSRQFLSLVPEWIRELREIASKQPETGACTAATALELWSWTYDHLRSTEHALDELADAVTPLLAARALVLEALDGPELRRDLSYTYAAHTAANAGAICAELVFGYRRHLVWDVDGCATCYSADALDDLEAVVPGMASGARLGSDVIESDGSHAAKAGPCARFDGVEAFVRLRNKLDGCLTGARIAKERAAAAIAVTAKSKGRAR